MHGLGALRQIKEALNSVAFRERTSIIVRAHGSLINMEIFFCQNERVFSFVSYFTKIYI